MSAFNAKMHQIRFRLQRFPRPPAGFNGTTSKKREGGEKEGEAKGKERGAEGKVTVRGICLLLNLGLATPLIAYQFLQYILPLPVYNEFLRHLTRYTNDG